MGPYRPFAGVDYNLTLYSLQSRLQHIYHGQPYASSQSRPQPCARVGFYPPVRDSGFGLRKWISLNFYLCNLTL
jgi:hypothetical protein